MRYRINNGKKSIRGQRNSADTTHDQVKDVAEQLGIPFSDATPGKHKAVQEGEKSALDLDEDSLSP